MQQAVNISCKIHAHDFVLVHRVIVCVLEMVGDTLVKYILFM